jgi:acetyl esterase/lipase
LDRSAFEKVAGWFAVLSFDMMEWEDQRWITMKLRFRWIIFAFLLCLHLPLLAQTDAGFKRTEEVIYGHKFGVSLSMDVFKPQRPNGCGILYMVSGGWISSRASINAGAYRPYLNRGYTVFAIVHGSQPKFIIPEVTDDIQRAVRFIRHNAAAYEINPQKLGITGASSGGHLSLTVGTKGGPGPDGAKDPVDRESSAVQAVACFFPPTDFLNYGAPGVDAVGFGILANFKPAFGSRADTEEGRKVYGKEISPIYFVRANLPPTLIIHGDADKLVPIQQAEVFVKKAREAGATAKLIVREGKSHGWGLPELAKDFESLADWFDEHLRGIKTEK